MIRPEFLVDLLQYFLEQIENEHVIRLAEGVFMCCKENEVRSLFFNLLEKLNNPEIVFEVFNSKWLKEWRKRVTEFKFKKELKLGAGASYQFGIPDSDAIESWDNGMKLLDDCSYLDSGEPHSGIIRLMGKNKSMRKVQWTEYYILAKTN